MNRLAQLTALVAVLALGVGATAGIAGTRPDDRANHGIGVTSVTDSTAVVRPDDRGWRGAGPAPASVTTRRSNALSPDDRTNHGVGAFAVVVADVVRPDDRAWRGAAAEPTPVVSGSSTGAGFDWKDAGIGAAGAFGFMLLFVGFSTLLVRRQRLTPLT